MKQYGDKRRNRKKHFFSLKELEARFTMSRPRMRRAPRYVTIAGVGPHRTRSTHLHLPENPQPLRCKVGPCGRDCGCDSVQAEPLCLAGTLDGRVISHLLCPHPPGTLAGFPLLSKWGEKGKKEREGDGGRKNWSKSNSTDLTSRE